MTSPIVLFDGVCNLCQASVQFIVRHDPRGIFTFASLQSDRARELLASVGRSIPEGTDPDSVYLFEEGRFFTASTAALRIARRLSGFWPVFYVFMLVPRILRDAVYGWVARNRYRWFGKSDQCMVPTPELRKRFIA